MSAVKIAPIGPKSKLYTKSVDEHVTYEEYAIANAKAHSLPAELIGKIARYAKAGEDFEIPEELPSKQAKAAKAFMIQSKSDFKAHAKNKKVVEANDLAAMEARKNEKLEEQAAKQADLDESTELMAKSLSNKTLVKAATQLTDSATKAIAASMPDGISLSDSGEVTIADGLSKKDYAEALASLVKLNEAGGQITDRSAKTEAQVAMFAKNNLGDNWTNLLKVNNPSDLDRIKKGIKTVEVCFSSKSGKSVFLSLPLSTTRALTEFKVTNKDEAGSAEKADAENLAAKNDVLKLAAAKLKAGEAVTQTVAKNLVSEYKKEKGIEGKVRFKYFYGIADEDGNISIYGTTDLNPYLLKLSVFALDSNSNRLQPSEKGVDSEAITGPDDDLLEKVRELAEADAEAKEKAAADKAKGKDKKKSSAKKSDADKKKDADDEEEDEEEEEEEVKPAKKGKAKTTPVVEEEDDDDEDEAEEEADDEEEEDEDEDEEEDD